MSYIPYISQPAFFPREYIKYVDTIDFFEYDGIQEGDSKRLYKDLDELYAHIKKRRKEVGLPGINNLEMVVQFYIYELGEADESFFSRKTIRDGIFRDIKKGVQIAISLGQTGGELVGKDLADSRALICLGCPNHLSLQKSPRERIQDHIAMVYSRFRRSSYHSKLKDCGVCGCSLQSKVFFSDKVIIENNETEAHKFPKYFFDEETKKKRRCWTREILDQEDDSE